MSSVSIHEKRSTFPYLEFEEEKSQFVSSELSRLTLRTPTGAHENNTEQKVQEVGAFLSRADQPTSSPHPVGTLKKVKTLDCLSDALKSEQSDSVPRPTKRNKAPKFKNFKPPNLPLVTEDRDPLPDSSDADDELRSPKIHSELKTIEFPAPVPNNHVHPGDLGLPFDLKTWLQIPN